MKRIDVRNSELLGDSNKKFTLSRKLKTGVIVMALVVGIPGLMFMSKNKNNDYTTPPDLSQFEQPILEDPINVNINDLNNLNIIINDHDCSDTFMKDIYNRLEEDGLIFETSYESNNVDKDESVVITLDQQYISGPGMIILAPYNNERKGNSDALVLAAKTAFYEKGFLVDDIECGVRGYREAEDGSVLEKLPTSTEEAIGVDKNTSFVTIAFGTENNNAELVAKSIENTLARYYSYINESNLNEDLIYRTTSEDSIESICSKFTTNEKFLKTWNNINSDTIPKDSTLKNPSVEVLREFNRTVPVSLEKDKVKGSK